MNWETGAACQGQFIDDFYPDSNTVLNAVKRICAGCPVREACLVAAIPERHGFWAGLTMIDRERLRASANIVLAPDDGDVGRYRRASQEAWRTGDYVTALGKILGVPVARRILEDNGVVSRRVA
jgi:WhiB family redox-sensing transcriptional regulator